MVGRGFLGQLLAESGYEVIFVDIDRELVDAINARRGYRLRLVDNEAIEELWITPASAIDGSDADCAAAALCDVGLAATAVGARALPAIAPIFAQAIARRAEAGLEPPLNIIVCENLKNAGTIFRETVRSVLNSQYHPYLERRVGFAMAVIGRMAPLIPSEVRQQDPALMIAEPYKELPVSREGFVGPIPDIAGLRVEPCFEAWVARKLYLHNTGHAMLAYLGYLKGLTYGYEALHDPDVRPLFDQALTESLNALVAAFGFQQSDLGAHVADLVHRFDNRALADTLFRLARDPLRKLGPEDRLVGAARLALQHGIVPRGLAWGIAAGLIYDDQNDRRAVELQGLVDAEGVVDVLQTVCGLLPNNPPSRQLFELVLARYAALNQGAFDL
jgi:mannitol-1-phosphate 5-dehydrogenase